MGSSPFMIFAKKNPQPKFLRPKNYAKKSVFYNICKYATNNKNA